MQTARHKRASRRKHEEGGFTLIELLVVIAIIGILSSVVLSSLQTARKKGQDSKTVQQFHQIANALEIYANDNGGRYPYVNRHSSPTFNCIGGTDCSVAGVSSGVKLPGITLNGATTLLIPGVGGYNSKSFSYVPIADCDSVSGTCGRGEVLIIAPTYNGLMCQTVGVWEKIFTCTTLPE